LASLLGQWLLIVVGYFSPRDRMNSLSSLTIAKPKSQAEQRIRYHAADVTVAYRSLKNASNIQKDAIRTLHEVHSTSLAHKTAAYD
jgi:hypothetical protein